MDHSSIQNLTNITIPNLPISLTHTQHVQLTHNALARSGGHNAMNTHDLDAHSALGVPAHQNHRHVLASSLASHNTHNTHSHNAHGHSAHNAHSTHSRGPPHSHATHPHSLSQLAQQIPQISQLSHAHGHGHGQHPQHAQHSQHTHGHSRTHSLTHSHQHLSHAHDPNEPSPHSRNDDEEDDDEDVRRREGDEEEEDGRGEDEQQARTQHHVHDDEQHHGHRSLEFISENDGSMDILQNSSLLDSSSVDALHAKLSTSSTSSSVSPSHPTISSISSALAGVFPPPLRIAAKWSEQATLEMLQGLLKYCQRNPLPLGFGHGHGKRRFENETNGWGEIAVHIKDTIRNAEQCSRKWENLKSKVRECYKSVEGDKWEIILDSLTASQANKYAREHRLDEENEQKVAQSIEYKLRSTVRVVDFDIPVIAVSPIEADTSSLIVELERLIEISVLKEKGKHAAWVYSVCRPMMLEILRLSSQHPPKERSTKKRRLTSHDKRESDSYEEQQSTGLLSTAMNSTSPPPPLPSVPHTPSSPIITGRNTIPITSTAITTNDTLLLSPAKQLKLISLIEEVRRMQLQLFEMQKTQMKLLRTPFQEKVRNYDWDTFVHRVLKATPDEIKKMADVDWTHPLDIELAGYQALMNVFGDQTYNRLRTLAAGSTLDLPEYSSYDSAQSESSLTHA